MHISRQTPWPKCTGVLAASVAFTLLAGCISPGNCCQTILDDKLACRAWRARSDCYHGEGKDFKYGFLDGYIKSMSSGGDICQPVVPPKRYWSRKRCSTAGCEVVNDYFNGWTHGVMAASQDEMAGRGTVPLRPLPKSAAIIPASATSYPDLPYEAYPVAPLPGPARTPASDIADDAEEDDLDDVAESPLPDLDDEKARDTDEPYFPDPADELDEAPDAPLPPAAEGVPELTRDDSPQLRSIALPDPVPDLPAEFEQPTGPARVPAFDLNGDAL